MDEMWYQRRIRVKGRLYYDNNNSFDVLAIIQAALEGGELIKAIVDSNLKR